MLTEYTPHRRQGKPIARLLFILGQRRPTTQKCPAWRAWPEASTAVNAKLTHSMRCRRCTAGEPDLVRDRLPGVCLTRC